MKIENIIKLIILVISIVNIKSDCENYSKLEIENMGTIKKENLPKEFSDKAFKTIDEFIRKTINLTYEYLLFFDYITGEILCAKGEKNNVKIDFNDIDFKNHHVASIHNHPSNVYSPPSGKNFSILNREFEDYELIAGPNKLWILKAKGVNQKLNIELKLYAIGLLSSCQEYCRNKYNSYEKINNICDIMYGIMLSNYINDKNLKDIQLTKKEYQS